MHTVLRIFCVSTAAELLAAYVLFDMSPPTHGTVCLVLFAIVTIFLLLNLNLKRTYLNKLLFTLHTSHIVVTALTNSFLLHTARYKFNLLTYLLNAVHRLHWHSAISVVSCVGNN